MIHSLLLPYLGKLVDRNYSFIMMWLSPLLLGFSVIYLAFVNTYYEFVIAWLLVSATSAGCLYTMIFSVLTINLKNNPKNSIAIITPMNLKDCVLGSSISCDGICLTINKLKKYKSFFLTEI